MRRKAEEYEYEEPLGKSTERKNRFFETRDLNPSRLRVGDSFDKNEPSIPINDHLQKKAQRIRSQLNSYLEDAYKNNKNTPLFRFYEGEQGLTPVSSSYQKNKELPLSVRKHFIDVHSDHNEKALSVDGKIYGSPFLSTTDSLPDFVKTSMGLEGDWNLRQFVFDRAPTIGVFDVPEKTPGGIFSKDKQNYIKAYESPGARDLIQDEKEVLYDAQNRPLQNWPNTSYENPLRGQMRPEFVRLQGKYHVLERNPQIDFYQQEMDKIPQDRVLNQEERQKYKGLRKLEEGLIDEFRNIKPTHPAPKEYIYNKEKTGLEQSKKYAQGGRVRKNDIFLTPEEARIAEVFNMSPAEYKKLQTARFKNQANQAQFSWSNHS